VETGDIVAVIGFLLFAWTGSSLFIEIQNDLNDIFKVPQERTSGLGAVVRKRLVGVAWAVSLGLTVVPIWVANLGGEWFESLIPLEYDLAHRILGWGTRLLSVGALTILFAVALKTMTRATIRWRAVLVGGVFTTTAFLLAAFGAGLYVAWDRGPSAPQIAGAFFVILLLASTLASVFLFGAQVTRVYNDHLSLVDRGR
jgi:uncharacterized BrkB/YihY/UPF0761 family membrane protein